MFTKMSLFKARLIYLRHIQSYQSQNLNRLFSQTCISNSKTRKENNVSDKNDDKPIEFSKTKAAKWKAEVSRRGAEDQAPWFQPYVISLSLSIFMLYFFYFREESDVDLEFEKNLYDRISGLEEKQLEIVLKYNLENNLPVNEIKHRLQEIRKTKENT